MRRAVQAKQHARLDAVDRGDDALRDGVLAEFLAAHNLTPVYPEGVLGMGCYDSKDTKVWAELHADTVQAELMELKEREFELKELTRQVQKWETKVATLVAAAVGVPKLAEIVSGHLAGATKPHAEAVGSLDGRGGALLPELVHLWLAAIMQGGHANGARYSEELKAVCFRCVTR